MISCKAILPLMLLFCARARAQGPRFGDSVEHIGFAAKGHVGADFMDAEANEGITVHGHDRFPMLSVYKFPLALYVLAQVDKGKLALEQQITVHKADWARTYSPTLESHQENTFHLSLREALGAAVSLSDNVACDLLFQLAGGPSVVNDYVHGMGIDEIEIVATEMEMAADPKNMYRNSCTPAAMGTLIYYFDQGYLLSPSSTQILKKWMIETSTGPHRIKGLLPTGTIVAHKTGSSGTNAEGMTAATNDVGIVTLPNGHHLYLVVFVADSHADEATREGVIARIARFAYDTYGR